MGKPVGFFNDCVNVSWRSLTPMLYAKAILGQTVICEESQFPLSKCGMKSRKEGIAPFVNRTVFPLRPLSMLFENHLHTSAYPTCLLIRI
jgi:hypothetical protein